MDLSPGATAGFVQVSRRAAGAEAVTVDSSDLHCDSAAAHWHLRRGARAGRGCDPSGGVRTSESESRRIRRSPLAAVRYGRNLPRRQFELPLAMRPGQVGPRDSAGRRAGARRGCRPGLSIRLASPGPDVKLRLGAHQVPGLPGPGRHQMSQLAAGASESESESRRLVPVTESRVPATRDSGESDELAGAGAASLIIE